MPRCCVTNGIYFVLISLLVFACEFSHAIYFHHDSTRERLVITYVIERFDADRTTFAEGAIQENRKQ